MRIQCLLDNKIKYNNNDDDFWNKMTVWLQRFVVHCKSRIFKLLLFLKRDHYTRRLFIISNFEYWKKNEYDKNLNLMVLIDKNIINVY